MREFDEGRRMRQNHWGRSIACLCVWVWGEPELGGTRDGDHEKAARHDLRRREPRDTRDEVTR